LTELDAMSGELEDHFDFLAATSYVPHAQGLTPLIVESEQASDGTVTGFARKTASLIQKRFRYEKGASHVQSTVMDALQTGAGVCQDFAHLMLAAVRMRGIPARYVSGYLVPSSAAAAEPGAEDVIGGQASHAWIEMLVPGAGWFGVDPTLGGPVGPRHVRLAYGRDYGDVAPVRGVYKGHAGQQLFVDVGVRPALDDDGKEYLEETAAAPREAPSLESAPQQEQQQQQQ
jgi:transglutaminase-like putative cysteine protease